MNHNISQRVIIRKIKNCHYNSIIQKNIFYKMNQRSFIIEKIINVLIIIRVFRIHLVPSYIYLLILAALFIAKYIKEGFTPVTSLLFPIIILQLFGQANDSVVMQYISTILGSLVLIIPLKLYWLPHLPTNHGFKEDSIQNGLHYYEFFPLDQKSQMTEYSIKWNHSLEMNKMIGYANIKNSIMKKVMALLLSYTEKQMITLGKGTQLKTNKSIAFCHGRGAAPFFYTIFLQYYASKGYRVGGVQHTDVNDTGLTQQSQIKRYREKEVSIRAAQFHQTILRANNEQIVLMGHSYGCATLIQAYHNLQKELKDKVSHIILLDPWLFPLTDEYANKQFSCPVLMLANQQFVQNNQDVCLRNTKFINAHKLEYILWKGAHHVHHTNSGFINGNTGGMIKNSDLSQFFFEINCDAINKFLNGQKVEGQYGEKDLGRSHKCRPFPQKDQLNK